MVYLVWSRLLDDGLVAVLRQMNSAGVELALLVTAIIGRPIGDGTKARWDGPNKPVSIVVHEGSVASAEAIPIYESSLWRRTFARSSTTANF